VQAEAETSPPTASPTVTKPKSVTVPCKMTISTATASFQFTSTVIMQWESTTSSYYSSYYQQTSGLQGASVTAKYSYLEQVEYTQVFIIHFSLIVSYTYTSISIVEVAQEALYTSSSKETYSSTLVENLGVDLAVDNVEYVSPPTSSPTKKPFFTPTARSPSRSLETDQPTPNTPKTVIFSSQMVISVSSSFTFSSTVIEQWESATSTYYTNYYQETSGLQECIVTVKYKSIEQLQYAEQYAIYFSLVVQYQFTSVIEVAEVAEEAFYTSVSKESYSEELGSILRNAVQVDTVKYSTPQPTMRPYTSSTSKPSISLPSSVNITGSLSSQPTTLKPTPNQPGDSTHAPSLNSTAYPSSSKTVYQLASLTPTRKPATEMPSPVLVSSFNSTASPTNSETVLQAVTSSPKPAARTPSPSFYNSTTAYPTRTETALQVATLSPTSKPVSQTSVPNSLNPTAFPITNETVLQAATSSPTPKPTTQMPSSALNSTTSYPTNTETVLQFATLSPTSKPVSQTSVPNSLNPTAFPITDETVLQAATSSPTPKPTTQMPSSALNSTTSYPTNTETVLQFATLSPTS